MPNEISKNSTASSGRKPEFRAELVSRPVSLLMLDQALKDRIWNNGRLEALTPGAE
jgi:hypothetical protein